MNIVNLTKNSEIYTSNAYLCTEGERQECSFLIDTGCDPLIIPVLKEISGPGHALPVQQIILTHSHYDHTRLVKGIKEIWPDIKAAAFSAYLDGIDQVLTGGETISVCSTSCEIIHLPGHSTDSVCVYFPKDAILFSGDSPLIIWGTEATYEMPFLTAFEGLVRLNIETIYPGHGEPITRDCNRMLEQSLRNLKRSRII